MSGWRIITRALYAKGGGPLPRAAFETPEISRRTLDRAKELGLIQFKRRAYFAEWELTQLGRDWCEGRATVIDRKDGATGRPKMAIGCTWLAVLPRCAA